MRLETHWPRMHFAHEANPLAGNSADQLLLPTAIAQRLARSVDAAGQC